MNIQEIKVSECIAFQDNPFQVRDDEGMELLVQSIREFGVMTPIVVRPVKEGGYEVISGHRRLHACRRAGIEEIPALIRDMERDSAVIFMVDSNIQREGLLPSEKAFAYKMKVEALRHQASMPRRKSEAALSQLLNIAKSEISPLLLLALFFLSILCGVCMSKDIASPMVTIFCISPALEFAVLWLLWRRKAKT